MQTIDHRKIPGWGADVRQDMRPGVPMEKEPTSLAMAKAPRTAGNTLPPRGLSGVLRRAAYNIPDHRSSHWLLLMFADRVDVVEGYIEDLARPRTLLIGGGIVGLGVIGWLFSRPRSAARTRRIR